MLNRSFSNAGFALISPMPLLEGADAAVRYFLDRARHQPKQGGAMDSIGAGVTTSGAFATADVIAGRELPASTRGCHLMPNAVRSTILR